MPIPPGGLSPAAFVDFVTLIDGEFADEGIECVNKPIMAINVTHITSMSVKRDVGQTTTPYSPQNCAFIIFHMKDNLHDYRIRI